MDRSKDDLPPGTLDFLRVAEYAIEQCIRNCRRHELIRMWASLHIMAEGEHVSTEEKRMMCEIADRARLTVQAMNAEGLPIYPFWEERWNHA